MTIDAVHAAFGMNVIEMHRLAELRGIVRRDNVALHVEQIAFAIAFEHFAKQPAVAVKVCKLRVAPESVDCWRTRVSQKIKAGPETTETCAFRIPIERLLLFILTRIVLRRWVHLRAVAFVVPPRQAEVRGDHVCAGMHVANHALRCWNLTRELVFDWVTRFIFLNRGVGCLRTPEISRLMIRSGVGRIAIVCVDNVTRGAAGGTVVTRVIVGAEEVQRWIEQACFLNPEKHWIRALSSTKASRTESLVRLARILFFVRQANFEPALSAALKHTQNISGLRNLPTRDRIEQAEETFRASLLLGACLKKSLRRT